MTPRRREDSFKTTARLIGVQDVDDFRALCALLGKQPHEMAAIALRQSLDSARQHPELGPAIVEMVANARAYQHRDGETGEPLAHAYAWTRGGDREPAYAAVCGDPR